MATQNILIVDDDPEMHDLVRAMLKDSHWSPDCVLRGEAALAKLKDQTYDVILTDILMPEMDGLTLLQWIQSVSPETKVLIMTAANRPDRVAGSIRGHAAGYLSKPFSRGQLLEALDDALACEVQPDDIEVISDKPNWIAVRARCTLAIAERIVRFFHELPAELDADNRDMASTAFR